MRKLFGFIFFVISLAIIASVLAGSIESIESLFSNLETEDFLPAVGLFAAFFWELLYQPIVVLLLSVIAMGDYSK